MCLDIVLRGFRTRHVNAMAGHTLNQHMRANVMSDPRTIPLTPEQQEMMDAINCDYMDDLIAAKRRYDDEVDAMRVIHAEQLQAWFLETATMTPEQLAAWRQERG